MVNAIAREEIPNKLYFRIGEVSDLVGVKPYVLRYWESEFPDVKPSKSKSGQRLYKRRDVEVLLCIKELLYQERFTINGARRRLKDVVKGDGAHASGEARGPHQLDVFSETETPPVREKSRPKIIVGSPDGGRTGSGHESGFKEGRKVLQKIRKDLESLLKVMHE